MTHADPVRALTVAVCTYGAAPHLAEALASVVEQEPPAGLRVEILCVDNNPAPTVTLANSLADRVRLIREPTPGLSRARESRLWEPNHLFQPFYFERRLWF